MTGTQQAKWLEIWVYVNVMGSLTACQALTPLPFAVYRPIPYSLRRVFGLHENKLSESTGGKSGLVFHSIRVFFQFNPKQ